MYNKTMMKKLIKIVILVVAAGVLLLGMFRLGIHFVQYPVAPFVKSEKVHIACVGDSITYGAGVLGHRSSQSYPAYLQEFLGDSYQVLNYGMSGRTLMDEGDSPYRQEHLYPESLEVQADICLLMLGTNDAKDYQWDADAYESQLPEMIRAYKQASPEGKIYIMQPPKAFSKQSDGTTKYGIQDEVIGGVMYEIIRQTAIEEGVGYIDLYTLTKDHEEWFPDGIHPNKEGNYAIASYIYQCLQGE